MKNGPIASAALILAPLIFASCADDAVQNSSIGTGKSATMLRADTLYTGGTIWTGVPENPDVSMLATKNGLVVYAGNGKDVQIDAAVVVDLHGQFLMPGFIDNHVHILDGGNDLASVVLRDAATPAEFSKRIAEFAAQLPVGQWVQNGNWDHEQWGGELPHRDWIDADTPNTPVLVYRLDGHMALANSVALKLAGIDASTVTPEGGEIVRDADGTPTGMLKDNALNLVMTVLPEPDTEQLLAVFDLAQDHALKLGLTQLHAVTAHANDTMFEVLQLAQQRKLMKIRVNAHAPLERWQQARDLVAHSGTGDGLLRWGSLKGFVDGSLGSTTAWFYEPYDDAPDTSGFALTTTKQLRSLMDAADLAGLRLAVHAIGDKAIDELINAMRATAGQDIVKRRYRIEHFQHPSATAIKMAAQHGIIASMQPYHAIDDGRWAERRIGPERIKTTYAFRSILDAGGILTFGSDWPVAPLSPLQGIYAAVTRRTTDGAHPEGWQPQEKITVEEALIAYTASNAYAAFEEDITGTLEVGKRADLVLLSADPRRVDPGDIPDIEIISTVINGTPVYTNELALHDGQ